MSATFDIHPDMDELIAAKREVAQAGDPEAMRARGMPTGRAWGGTAPPEWRCGIPSFHA